jgi:hypothetical protein
VRFRIAEEVARSPFGVQIRQDLDSGPGAVDLTDVMAVENKSLRFEPLCDVLDANASGSAIWNAMVNFKGLGATLLAKKLAERKSDMEKVAWCRARIDSMADHARQQTAA